MEMWSLILFTSLYLQVSTNMFIQQKAIQHVLPNGPNMNVSWIKKISMSFTECTNDDGSPVTEEHVNSVQDCMSHSKQVTNPNLVRPVRFQIFPMLTLLLIVSVLRSTGTKLPW